DTELLLVAERSGLRIHEVPVDWVDDPDSRVRVAQTARRDLAGMARMAWRFLRGAGRIDGATYGRAELADQMGRQLVVFGLIGTISTGVSAGLFLALREPLGAVLANVVAVTATVAVNAWANRRFTFGRRGRLGRSSDYLRAGAIYLVGLVVSTFVLSAISPTDHLVELLALLATWSLTTVARFTVLSHTPITSTEVQP
ncbi:MAG TPA: GtrA family protein, partial [Microthrixaceae bacterium]|nr:GtrA family protein [Microthrixaceae bacterium]